MQLLEGARKAREHGCCSRQSLKAGWMINPEFYGVRENVSFLFLDGYLDTRPTLPAQPVLTRLS